jgi:hypothetical protein
MPDDADDDLPEDNIPELESRALVPVPRKEVGGEIAQVDRGSYAGVLNNIFQSAMLKMKMTFQNLPTPILSKKITPEGVIIRNLPDILDGADSYFKSVLLAIENHPDAVPDAVDKENLRHAFLTLAFVQQQLDDIVEFHGEKQNGPGIRLTPRPYTEYADRKKPSFYTSLDIGAQTAGEKGRNRELSGIEKLSLKDVSESIVHYTSIVSQLLGVQLVGYKMIEGEEYGKFNIAHADFEKVRSAAPPKPWADGMEGFSVKIPSHMNVSVSFRE